MSIKINEMIKTIKELKPDTICLFKVGTFFHCYNRDSYIVAYLFGYQVRNIENNGKECGFPINSLDKVIEKLENENINYAIYDKKDNYSESKVCDFKELNEYSKYFEKARKYINYKFRIERINNKLLLNIDTKELDNNLTKIEDILFV